MPAWQPREHESVARDDGTQPAEPLMGQPDGTTDPRSDRTSSRARVPEQVGPVGAAPDQGGDIETAFLPKVAESTPDPPPSFAALAQRYGLKPADARPSPGTYLR